MLFTRKSLLYAYSWTHTEDDDPKFMGKPDGSLLNRHVGYEVLYLINQLMEDGKFTSEAMGRKIETMIQHHPAHLKSQLEIKNWIKDQWNRY